MKKVRKVVLNEGTTPVNEIHISLIFDDYHGYTVIVEDEFNKRQFNPGEFPFNVKNIVGRDADEVLEYDAAGNATWEVWHIK